MVECLPRGEVSGFLHDVVEVGDELELRGPIGRWFVWGGEVPSLCVAGGSGVVPFVSMLRYARRMGTASHLTIVASAQTRERLPYIEELEEFGAFIALTRENHGDRVAAHIYPDELAELSKGIERAYVCGSAGFVSFVGRSLGEAGVPSDIVRVEQFGATALPEIGSEQTVLVHRILGRGSRLGRCRRAGSRSCRCRDSRSTPYARGRARARSGAAPPGPRHRGRCGRPRARRAPAP